MEENHMDKKSEFNEALMLLVLFLKTNRGAVEYIQNPDNPTETKSAIKNRLATAFLSTRMDFNIT